MANEVTFKFIKIRYLVLLLIVLTLILSMILAITNLTGPEWDLATGFLIYILIFWWILKNFNRVNLNLGKFIGHLPIKFNWLLLFIITIALILLSLGLGEFFIYVISVIDPSTLNELPSTTLLYTPSDTPLAPYLNMVDFTIAVILAPFVEEFLFRGVMLHRFTIKWGIRPAILVSSVIFAFLHTDIIGAFIFGVVMCVLYIKTSSILVPIVAHMINNLLAYVLVILSSFGPESAKVSYNLEAAVLFLIVSVAIISYFLLRNWPQRYWRPPYFQEAHNGIPENYYY